MDMRSLAQMLAGMILVAACQEPGVVLLPGRVGAPPESPPLGPNLGAGDRETCRELRMQLASSIVAMEDSLEQVKAFSRSPRRSRAEIASFEIGWRADFVAQKEKLFALPTCSEFVAEWALALATWRDVFRYQKEVASALRDAQGIAALADQQAVLDRNLSSLRRTLVP